MRSLIFQSLPRIMDETITERQLFETVAASLRRGSLWASSPEHGDAAPWLQLYFFARIAPHQLPLRNNMAFHCGIELTSFRAER